MAKLGGGGFPTTVKEPDPAWNESSLVMLIGKVVVESLQAANLIGTEATIDGGDRGGSWSRLFLEGATVEEEALFVDSMREVLGPLDNPRYMLMRVARYFQVNLEPTLLSRLPMFFDPKEVMLHRDQTAMWHAVPKALAKRGNWRTRFDIFGPFTSDPRVWCTGTVNPVGRRCSRCWTPTSVQRLSLTSASSHRRAGGTIHAGAPVRHAEALTAGVAAVVEIGHATVAANALQTAPPEAPIMSAWQRARFRQLWTVPRTRTRCRGLDAAGRGRRGCRFPGRVEAAFLPQVIARAAACAAMPAVTTAAATGWFQPRRRSTLELRR